MTRSVKRPYQRGRRCCHPCFGRRPRIAGDLLWSGGEITVPTRPGVHQAHGGGEVLDPYLVHRQTDECAVQIDVGDGATGTAKDNQSHVNTSPVTKTLSPE